MNIIKALLSEICIWTETLLVKNTPGRVGYLIRKAYWSLVFKNRLNLYMGTGCVIAGAKNIKFGQNASIMHDCSFYAETSGSLTIGDRFSANCRVMVDASDGGEVVIGNDVSVGPNVVMRASNHEYKARNVVINKQGHSGGKIVIGNDVWMGANCTILPGAVIGDGAVIGAGAVVNKAIPSYSLAGGVPVRVIKTDCRK
jgi:galactoside O-acetyltransferase